MSKRNRNGGYTLLEMLLAMAIASIITLAATSVLLLGMRINRQSADTIIQQSNTRILMSAFESLSANGTVKEIHVEPDSWVIRDENDRPMLTYQDGVIAHGSGMTVLEGVTASSVKLENNLLTYKVETADGVYESSIYCRSAVVDNMSTGNEEADVDQKITFDSVTEGRKQFLEVLSSQLGSDGRIMLRTVQGEMVYAIPDWYYAEWYIGEEFWGYYDWNEDTPWCACYVSWAIEQCYAYINYDHTDDNTLNDLPKFANVDFFRNNFIDRGTYIAAEKMEEEKYTPKPGDIIFFDWTIDPVDDPEHVGVVAAVSTEADGVTYVYTIEGNNGDRVVICRYKIDNPQILGYGWLNWDTDSEQSE